MQFFFVFKSRKETVLEKKIFFIYDIGKRVYNN